MPEQATIQKTNRIKSLIFVIRAVKY